MELCSMYCGSQDGKGVWGWIDTCICMAVPFCCSPETITTLVIGYTLIQNKRFKRKKKKEEIVKKTNTAVLITDFTSDSKVFLKMKVRVQ